MAKLSFVNNLYSEGDLHKDIKTVNVKTSNIRR